MNDSAPHYYESDALLRQYLEFHYGPSYLGVANYPQSCARRALAALTTLHGPDLTACTALELGCAVGRTAFELAAVLGQVTAIDLSARFIDAAGQLQQNGSLSYTIDRQGELCDPRLASLPALGLAATRERVRFLAADATTTRQAPADLVLAANLIDRLNDPAAFLRHLPQLIKPGGLLLLSSPYTVLQEFTPRQNWLGGWQQHGREITVEENLKRLLGEVGLTPFAPAEEVPFVIRETARKFQHTLAELTLWQRQN